VDDSKTSIKIVRADSLLTESEKALLKRIETLENCLIETLNLLKKIDKQYFKSLIGLVILLFLSVLIPYFK
jgi:hypothetical protein